MKTEQREPTNPKGIRYFCKRKREENNEDDNQDVTTNKNTQNEKRK